MKTWLNSDTPPQDGSHFEALYFGGVDNYQFDDVFWNDETESWMLGDGGTLNRAPDRWRPITEDPIYSLSMGDEFPENPNENDEFMHTGIEGEPMFKWDGELWNQLFQEDNL